MPKLIKLNADGDWQIDSTASETVWVTADTWQPGQALLLPGDAEPESAYAEADSIAIEFPAFNDGRGLSLAVLLRTRIGFAGDIRAVGEVHEDLLHYMARCGFSSFELADERDVDQALALVAPYSDHYQASILQPTPAFRRVQRG